MVTQVELAATAPVALVAPVSHKVYSFVHTYDEQGKIVDTRVIDMSDNGARKWLLNHHWWSLTNKQMIGLTVASKDDHDRYQLERLANKFNRAS